MAGGPFVFDHSIIINGLIVCTLGKDCGTRVAKGWPKADSLYGTGYWYRGDSEWLSMYRKTLNTASTFMPKLVTVTAC